MAKNTIGNAYIQILPSMDGMKGKLLSVLNKEGVSAGQEAGEKTGNSLMTRLKSSVVAIAGSLAIGKTVSESLMAGANLEQQIGGIETLFKDSAGKMREFADQAYKTSGMSASHYMETATSFSATLLKGLGGDTAKAADYANTAIIQMSDNANKMGTDMEMIQNAYQGFAKQNYDMLDNLALGYGGTQEEMARLINDSGVLGDAVKVTAKTVKDVPFNTIIDAIGKIQDDLGITGTTAKEASVTFEGSFMSMKAAAQNLLASLMMNGKDGVDVTVAMQGLITSASTFFFGNFIPAIGRMISAIPPALSTFVQSVDWGSLINSVLTTINTFFSTMLPGYINSAYTMIVQFLNSTFPGWIEQGTQLIRNLITGVTNALPNLILVFSQMLSTVLQFIGDNIFCFLESGLEIIQALVEGVIQSLPSVVQSIASVVQSMLLNLMDNMPEFLQKGVEVIRNLITGVTNALPTLISSLAQGIFGLIATIASNLPEFLQKGIEIIGELASGVVEAIPNLISKIPEICSNIWTAFTSYDWIGIGKNILEGIGQGVINAISGLLGSVKKACGKLVDGVKDFFGIHSPSRVFRDEVGQYIPAGIAVGIDNGTGTAVKAVKQMNDDILNSANVSMFAPDIVGTVSSGSLGSGSYSAGSDINYGGVTINLYAAPGQDVKKLAQQIEKLLRNSEEIRTRGKLA